MKRKISAMILSFMILSTCLMVSLPARAQGVTRKISEVPLIGQETDNSCWAACSQMVLQYYGTYGPLVSQIQTAREIGNESYYFDGLPGTENLPFVGGWEGSLERLGQLDADPEWGAPHPEWGLSFEEVVNDINLNRPIIAITEVGPLQNHAVLIIGYIDNPDSDTDEVILHNPAPVGQGVEEQRLWTTFQSQLTWYPPAIRTIPKVEKGEISIQFVETRSSGILRFIASSDAAYAWWTKARKWDTVGKSWANIPGISDEMKDEEARTIDIDIDANGAGNYRLILSATMLEQATWAVKIIQIPTGWICYGYDMARTGYYPYPSKYNIPNKPFETLWTSPHEGKNLMALTGDVNGDGRLEVAKVSGDNLKVISDNGTGLWTETIPGEDSYYGTGWLRLDLLEDVTGDGVPEIFVARKVSHYQSNLYVYDGDGNLIKTISRSVGRDGNMWTAAVFDVDGDGDKEIFCGIGSNYVGNPRGACLFDYDTGTELWYYAAGNTIADSMADLNNDGLLEITSTWASVHNGASGGGKGSNTYTSDDSVYVVVINENGDEIFTREIHGTHNHGSAFERIVDLDRDGAKEIVVLHSHEPTHYPGYAETFLWDSNGNDLKSYQGSYNCGFGGIVIADINKDGKDEVIVGSNDGVFRVMDHNLGIIDSANHYYVPQVVNDINGDGELEIIVSDYNTRELVVLGNNLDELWKLSFPTYPSAIVSDVDSDGVNDLVITADRLYVASSPSRVKLPTPVFNPAIDKISLRFATEPVSETWGPGNNVHVEIYDISPRHWRFLTDLSQRAEDLFLASFDCNAFRNRDANESLTHGEITQNVYEAIPEEVIDELCTYLPEMFVVYSVISTYASLFANFGMEIIEGSQPSTADAFGVLTFAIPESLENEDWIPTYIYDKYGYLDEGEWNVIGTGFGTGSLNTVSVYCLADLQVMDSLGRLVDKATNQIPGASYFETDLNQDGELDDTIILPETPGLKYTIWVIPEPEAMPNDTFTLVLGSVDIGIPLAENVTLSEAPESGYELVSLLSPQERPPITTLTVGEPQYFNLAGDLIIRSITPLTLTVHAGQFEVLSTMYRIYNGTYDSGWTTYTQPFHLIGLSDGTYYIDYNSTDNTGNIEPTKTATLVLNNSPPLDVDPDTLNLRSKGNWVTAYIEFLGSYNVTDIDVTSISLNGTIPVDAEAPIAIKDHDNDTVPDLMVKFNRAALTSYIYHDLGITYGNVTLTITGNLTDETPFEYSDTIRVIFVGDVNDDGVIDSTDLGIFGVAWPESPHNPDCDFNGDGVVDSTDYGLLATNYGATVS